MDGELLNPAAKKCSKDEGDQRSLNLYIYDLSRKEINMFLINF